MTDFIGRLAILIRPLTCIGIISYAYSTVAMEAKKSTIAQDMHSVAEISFVHHRLFDKNAFEIAQNIRNNNTLEVLNLNHQKFSSQGIKVIADALKYNYYLKVLRLDFNNIGNDGAFYLADALRINQSLLLISLHFCNISDEGVIVLTRALKENQTLEIIGLNSHKVSERVWHNLLDAIQDRSSDHALSTGI